MRVALLGLMLLASAPAVGADVQIRLYPRQPLIEPTRLGQALNFDFELVNGGPRKLELTTIRAAVRDASGAIVQRLELNDNGALPGIHTVPTRVWQPGEAHTVINPFHSFPADAPIWRIDFEFVLKADDGSTVTERTSVAPAPYRQKTRLVVPLPGRVLVWDGHDFYAHHRRWDFSNATFKRLGLTANPGRYSLDLVVADADGRFFAGSGSKPEDYFGYGATVVAPGAGRVVAAANDASDEPREPTVETFRKDPMLAVYGNYVVIDHGDGEYSQIGHLKRGSLKVKAGDRVAAGQPIAAVGQSGTSIFPHVHYQLVTRPSVDGEGLPARFSDFVRLLGTRRLPEQSATIDSGDIIESRARP